ncbi:MAG TPA: hypothetical protein ENH82_15770 [bacterium]|nr:hypothetical protein [bacterium]
MKTTKEEMYNAIRNIIFEWQNKGMNAFGIIGKIKESGIIEAELFQHLTLSKESVMEVLIKLADKMYSEGATDGRYTDDELKEELKPFETSICNLTPAVSDDKLLELLLSENGLDDDRIAKLFKDSRDAEYKAILEALHEAWEEIKQLKSNQPAKGEEWISMKDAQKLFTLSRKTYYSGFSQMDVYEYENFKDCLKQLK